MSSLSYVTIEEAKQHLRIAECDVDETSYIDLIIKASSGAVKNYLGNFSAYEGQRNADDDYYLDSNYEPQIDVDSIDGQLVKPEVKMAVLLMIGEWYKNREGDGSPLVHYVLPAPVLALLYPLRDPVVR